MQQKAKPKAVRRQEAAVMPKAEEETPENDMEVIPEEDEGNGDDGEADGPADGAPALPTSSTTGPTAITGKGTLVSTTPSGTTMTCIILGQGGNLCCGCLLVPQTVCRWEVHGIHVPLWH